MSSISVTELLVGGQSSSAEHGIAPPRPVLSPEETWNEIVQTHAADHEAAQDFIGENVERATFALPWPHSHSLRVAEITIEPWHRWLRTVIAKYIIDLNELGDFMDPPEGWAPKRPVYINRYLFGVATKQRPV